MIGTILTDDQVRAAADVKQLSDLTTDPTLVAAVLFVEDAAARVCGRPDGFLETAYADFQIETPVYRNSRFVGLRGPSTVTGLIFPISVWTRLNVVTGYSVTGATVKTELDRAGYQVDMATGVIRLASPGTVLAATTGVTIATRDYVENVTRHGNFSLLLSAEYVGGFEDAASVPGSVTTAMMSMLSRYYKMRDKTHLTAISGRSSSATYLRSALTEEEIFALDPWTVSKGQTR